MSYYSSYLNAENKLIALLNIVTVLLKYIDQIFHISIHAYLSSVYYASCCQLPIVLKIMLA